MGDTVDIICSVLDGDRFLSEAIESIRAQTHTDWRLWLRDDGSHDRTIEIMHRWAATDPRVRVLNVGGPRLGVAGAYGWLLERVPSDARYIMVADADDVWLPRKIEVTLATMQRGEAESPPDTPILVHSDLVVVNERLEVTHPSYWQYTGLEPEPATLGRHIIRTLMAGPTLMVNAALRRAIGRTPPVARAQDSWFGLVAIALGRVVVLREATVLYRQHGLNDAGGVHPRFSLGALPMAVMGAAKSRDALRRGIAHSAALAQALLDHCGPRLSPKDRALLEGVASLPLQPFWRRRLALLRYRALPEFGLLRRLGVVVRG